MSPFTPSSVLGKRTRSLPSPAPPTAVQKSTKSDSKRQRLASLTIIPEDDISNKENVPPPEEPEADTPGMSQRELRARTRAQRDATEESAIDNSDAAMVRRRRAPASRQTRGTSRSISRLAQPPADVYTPPHTPSSSGTSSSSSDDLPALPVFPKPTSARAPVTPSKSRVKFMQASDFETPSRALSTLSISTPPRTPSQTSAHAKARTLLRSSSSTGDDDATVGLTGRSTERAQIMSFLAPFVSSTIDATAPTSMYISGAPGTGKTALVTDVLRELAACNEGMIETTYVNCMGIKEVSGVWERVVESIAAEKSPLKKGKVSAERLLRKVLNNDDVRCVLVLDELDSLPTLAPIFELPASFPNALRIVGISNDLTLSTSSTPQEAKSTPSLATLNFAPYTAPEIQAILTTRLATSSTLIHPPALTLLAKKVSSQSGDIRFAMEVLRRALEIAEKDKSGKGDGVVGMKHVLDALRAKETSASAAGSGVVSVVRGLGLHARLVLVAILVGAHRVKRGLPLLPTHAAGAPSTGSKASSTVMTPSALHTLYTHLLTHSATEGGMFTPVSRNEFTDLLGLLDTMGLVSLEGSGSALLFSPSKRGRRPASEGSVTLAEGAREEDVVKGLTTVDASGAAGIKEEEVRRIWERESSRVDKEAKGRQDKHEESVRAVEKKGF
ncbi:hypothetical protein BOTBODRAFT_54810 [Botryobasidium botryosum FD-172 SS1]|uniref:AAA+ ATPase domain-containing protein n=1 Tax=Botryobasidium botryosum (strain FD-172 SS1) TaxID=930990 RepID=A0A067MUD4_BOTB1|nr:hypothetical protein BOTBODRAFT_54810 [Botryobasidium botryosum FD-172 SS1]